MNRVLWLLLAAGLAGCSSSRISRFDEFEKLKVDRITGNAVSGKIFARTLVCLNPMRESRGFVNFTNQTVTLATNYVVVTTTNQTVSTSSNQQFAAQTNSLAALPPIRESSDAPAPATNAPADSLAGGVTISTARNETVNTSPNQLTRSGSSQTVTSLNNQITSTHNNLAVTSGTNEVTTVDTSYTITTVTNPVVTATTNVAVRTSDNPVADYYLNTEIAPADFQLSPGESLVVLVDGVRHGFSASTPASGWESRRGFLTTFYKVPPDVIVDIANAKEVRLRIRGSSGMIEREMSSASRRHFREFLLKHFGTTEQASKQTDKNGNGL